MSVSRAQISNLRESDESQLSVSLIVNLFFKSWFFVISDLPERKKYHTFENLILTDKLFAIMVSKGM